MKLFVVLAGCLLSLSANAQQRAPEYVEISRVTTKSPALQLPESMITLPVTI